MKVFLNNMGVRNKSDMLISVLIVVDFLFLFASRISEDTMTMYSYALVSLSFIVLIYGFIKLHNNKVYIKFLKFCGVLSIMYALNFLLVGNLAFKQLLFGTIVAPALASALYFFRINKLITLFLFVAVLYFFIFKMFVLVEDANFITVNSRNYISYYLFLSILPFFWSYYRERGLPSFLFPAILLVMSVFAIGRGGIIMSFVLIIGWLLMRMEKSKHRILFIVSTIIIISILFYVYVDPDFLDLYFGRFEKEGFDSNNRSEGWVLYLKSLLSPQYLLMGSPISNIHYITSTLGGSLHNSYLTAHARMGIICLLYFVLIYRGMKTMYKQKNLFFFFFFLSFLVKAYLDADFPCTGVLGDIYVYLIVLIGLNGNFKIRQINNESKGNCTLSTSVSPHTGE